MRPLSLGTEPLSSCTFPKEEEEQHTAVRTQKQLLHGNTQLYLTPLPNCVFLAELVTVLRGVRVDSDSQMKI